MNARQRVLAVLERRPVDRLPVDIWHTDEVLDDLRQHCGTTDDLEVYRRLGVDKIVWVFPIYLPPGDDGPTGSTHFGQAERSMWGTPLKPVRVGRALYQEFGEPPLAGAEAPRDLDDYPLWPEPDRFDYAAMDRAARTAAQEFAVLGPWVSFFEIYCQIRGLEAALTDLALNPPLVDAALDRIEAIQTEMMRRFLQDAGDAVDLVFVSDDMGCQTGLLLSPDTWDRFFAARMRRWCEQIHGFGKRVFYHTDGAALELIPRLLDCGIDVLNPIQHVCPGMDRAGLKRRFGDRLIFHGGIDNQRVLPFGSLDDVRAETRACLETLGAGGQGCVVCSCHNIQPGTPVENILAMIDTVHTEGGRVQTRSQ
jgi:uroporphyrinogen decarboxylase